MDYLIHRFVEFQEPERSPSPSPPPDDDQNDNDHNEDEEAELLESIAEKEAEMRQTQELLNERHRQMAAALAELHRINELLIQMEIHEHAAVHNRK